MERSESHGAAPEGPPRWGPARLRVARGARTAEALLLDAVCAEAAAPGAGLEPPVRVVVPSRSLRLHVGARLVAHAGRALAGVAPATLAGTAHGILERAGERAPAGEALVPVVVRQLAGDEPALRAALHDLVDGYAAVESAVRDLLDAGFESAHAEALEERLAAIPGASAGGREDAGGAVARAAAIVRVAARTRDTLEAWEVGHRSRLYERAAWHLAVSGGGALPARAVFVHGFAEATGRAADLLEALVRHAGARVLFEEPADPAAARFARRLRERLESAAGGAGAPEADEEAPPPELSLLEASGCGAELRAVGERVLDLLARGVRPEAIGVVARDWSRRRAALRLHFGRLGVPFSGVAETGSADASARRREALLELLHRREDAWVDTWLECLVRLDPGGRRPEYVGRVGRADLRLGLRRLGALRVADAAAIPPRERDLPLPVRLGLRGAPDEDAEEDASPGDGDAAAARALRRRLRAEVLARAVERAQAARDRLAGWPATDTLEAHLERLLALLTRDLGWSRRDETGAPFLEALAAARDELPATAALSREDLVLLLRKRLEGVGATPLGGRGGGVQVLSAMEARSRTFEHLFLVGMNRDVFPRSVREDPLLPDALRRALADVLPEIPVKATGHDEERWLFADLLSASSRVVLSCEIADEDGRAVAASPFVERLRLERPELRPERARPLLAPSAGPHAPEEPPAERLAPGEHAIRAGLSGDTDAWERALRVACAQARAELGDAAPPGDADSLARARARIRREVDWEPWQRPTLGPYLGFVGRGRPGGDARSAALFVTALEGLARCPWQRFLRRFLGLEPTPDPLEALPDVNPLLLGSTVHAALERIVRDALDDAPEALSDLRGREGVAVPWPAPARLEAILREAASEALEDEGGALRGIAGGVVARARPLVERARELDWSQGPPRVLGAEVVGRCETRGPDGAPLAVHFRADRVDRAEGDGDRLLLTDYKTGKPLSTAATPAKRREHFAKEVARGRSLQAVVYAHAGGADDRGRFLYLKPDVGDEAAAYGAERADEDLREAFEGVVGAALGASDAGALFPRLVEPDLKSEGHACEWCEVKEACVRGDSGTRQRLVEWMRAREGEGERRLSEAERALLPLWDLRR